MRRALNAIFFLIPMAIAAPVIAQTGGPGGPGNGAGVPGPEIGVGVIGLLAAAGMVRYLQKRAKR